MVTTSLINNTIMELGFSAIIRRIIYGVVGIIVLVIFFGSFTIIEAGERGIVLNWGAFTGDVLQPGLHFVLPIAQSVTKSNVRTILLTIDNAPAYSRDLQIVDVNSTLAYSVEPNDVGLLYAEVGPEYESRVILPVLTAAIKQVYAQYVAEELLTKRGEVQQKIEELVRTTLTGRHLVIQHYSIINEDFSEKYEQAIEQKQIAEQAALKANHDLERIKIEASQRIEQAKAEAEAIKIQAEAIQQQGGAAYVDLQAIAKWNGVLPTQMVPGSAVPFLNINR